MMNHVSARCAQYRLLFPSRNIESIVTLDEDVRLLPQPRRLGPHPGAEHWPTLDLSRLLGATPRRRKDAHSRPAEPTGERPRIQLDWVSSDSLRRAALIVDAVDEIVASHLQHLEQVAFLPSRLLPLCDGVLRDADSTCRLSVRFDVAWPMIGFAERRLWREALVRIEAVSSPGRATETTHSPVPA
jgi:hypothetical protein